MKNKLKVHILQCAFNLFFSNIKYYSKYEK